MKKHGLKVQDARLQIKKKEVVFELNNEYKKLLHADDTYKKLLEIKIKEDLIEKNKVDSVRKYLNNLIDKFNTQLNSDNIFEKNKKCNEILKIAFSSTNGISVEYYNILSNLLNNEEFKLNYKNIDYYLYYKKK